MKVSQAPASVSPIDSARFEEGCQWFLDLREEPQSPELVTRWLEWCRADPRNREAFERACSIWQSTAGLRAKDLGLPDPLANAKRAAPVAPRRTRWQTLWILSGSLVVGLAAVLVLPPFRLLSSGLPVTAHFATRVGENQTMHLADGSTLLLGAGSRVSTSFDKHERKVVLEQGEAFFRVTHDKARPFIVIAGTYSVTAIGTAFNVRKSEDRVVVSVAEGTVAVGPPAPSQPAPVLLRDTLRAGAGQSVVLDNAAQQLQLVRIEPRAVALWRSGRLEFAREPLRAVIASVNRYADRQVTFEDAQLGELRFTGTIFADRVDDWIQGLPQVFPVTVRDDGAGIVIASQPQRE